MKFLIVTTTLGLLATAALAQSPYAGLQTRPIKTLSEQQVADLKAGRGMGLALAAELNGYPGPAHVLELSNKLGLTAEQKARVKSLFDSMKAEAIPLAAKLLQQEVALDQRFASHSITAESLKTMTEQIGLTQAALRDTHLKYHLRTAEILTAEQMQQYSMLRGNGSMSPMHHHREIQRTGGIGQTLRLPFLSGPTTYASLASFVHIAQEAAGPAGEVLANRAAASPP
jgi:hypothetical protein